MQVIRLEDDTGRGVFCVDWGWGFPEELRRKAWEHPGPYDDRRLCPQWQGVLNRNNMQFGFANTRQMLDWFPRKALRLLRTAGVRIVRYEVKEFAVLHGDHQVVFDRRKAARVN